MKIYLAGSMSAGREFEGGLKLIARNLADEGHQIISPWVLVPAADFANRRNNPEKVKRILERDLRAMSECDAAVVEVSQPSHGVGYELAVLERLGKPVICLKSNLQQDSLTSAMIEGNLAFVFHYYDEENINPLLREFLEGVERSKEGGLTAKERKT